MCVRRRAATSSWNRALWAGRFVPDTLGAVYRNVEKFLHVIRAAVSMEEYSSFDLLRCSAGARLHPSGPFPAASALVPCLRNASLYRAKKSLVLACVCGTSRIVGIERQMRRLFGPMGGSGHQDVLSVGGGRGGDKVFLGGWGFRGAGGLPYSQEKTEERAKGASEGEAFRGGKGGQGATKWN